ncbi:hypothetical protein GDO81_029060 [Engystomops pustulosus]|uniref:Secreted protein n=1 Tax=Engystomops pustulosus TaxID=76066 RepID=A0AAV6ZLR2_ENGPU|nr:hypothetical protein GDO81_029060 [Engystomops pustulosus]
MSQMWELLIFLMAMFLPPCTLFRMPYCLPISDRSYSGGGHPCLGWVSGSYLRGQCFCHAVPIYKWLPNLQFTLSDW